MPAIWQAMSETSNSVIRLAPLLPASKAAQTCPAPTPKGVTKPIPVMTTRRMLPSGSHMQVQRPKAGLRNCRQPAPRHPRNDAGRWRALENPGNQPFVE